MTTSTAACSYTNPVDTTHPVALPGPFRSHSPVLAAGLGVSLSPPSTPLRLPGVARVSPEGCSDVGVTTSRKSLVGSEPFVTKED